MILVVLLTCGGGEVDAPVAAPEPGGGFWGVALGAYPWEAEARGFPFPPNLREVRELGATDVLVPVSYRQATVQSNEVTPGPHTIEHRDLRALVRQAHRDGLRTILVPILHVERGGPTAWRGVVRPANPDAWWASYQAYVLRYAALAAQENVGLFVIGSELTSMTGPTSSERWRTLAAAVREVYRGPLAYCSNHDGLQRRAPFEFVDYAAVSAYFPLADTPDPQDETVRARAAAAVAEVRALGASVKRPVLLLEVGFPSADGALMTPWDQTGGAPIDLEEQALGYRAIGEAVLAEEAIEGTLFWHWFGPGGEHDRYFTPRGKPAEAELEGFLRQIQAR